jgi:Zn-dependent protease with chaperone function
MMRDFEHQVDEFSISKGYKLETAWSKMVERNKSVKDNDSFGSSFNDNHPSLSEGVQLIRTLSKKS